MSKPTEEAETFTATMALKWVKRGSDHNYGFIFQRWTMPYMKEYMVLQQAWRGDKGTIVWRDIEIE